MFGASASASASVKSLSGLVLADWEKVGTNTLTTLTKVGDDLVLAHASGTPTQFGMTLVGVSQANVRIRGHFTTTGWADGVDAYRAGPGLRLSGTLAVNDWNGYTYIQRRIAGNTFRKSPRKYVAGTVTNVGTETTGLSSASWLGMGVKFLSEVNGTSVSHKMWLDSVNEPASFDTTYTDTDVTGAGKIGIWVHGFTTGQQVALHSFTWEAL